ncbi:acylneuraminate cytidylyltransferase family protein [Desulfonatronum parangueonense]
MSKKVVAVVPVRKGSQRVKSKNTRPFADTNILELKIQVLKNVRGLDDIIINTDCEISIDIAKKHGVSYHKREEYFASSQATNDQHWKHIAEVTHTDILMMTQTTSPLVKVSTHQQALDSFLDDYGRYDSFNSVTSEKKFLWLDGKPINYKADETPKSQDLPDIVSLNFAITIIDRGSMITRKNVVGFKPKFITLSRIESVDLDEEMDFEFAEFLYKKLGYEWLTDGTE